MGTQKEGNWVLDIFLKLLIAKINSLVDRISSPELQVVTLSHDYISQRVLLYNHM